MTRTDKVAATMDWAAHEDEAQRALGEASTPDEVEAVRVRFTGRKSELAQALRQVRDRDSGILLNGVRGRLEASIAEREAELERSELERRLTEESVDVTLPGDELPLGRLHPLTQVHDLNGELVFVLFHRANPLTVAQHERDRLVSRPDVVVGRPDFLR